MLARIQRSFAVLLGICACFFVARAVLTMTSQPSLGVLGQSVIWPLVFLSMAGVVQYLDLSRVRLPGLPLTLGWQAALLIIAVAVPVAYGAQELGHMRGGMTTYLVAIAMIGGAALVLFLSITRNDAWALVGLLAISPFWGYFLKWNSQLLFWLVVLAMACRLVWRREWMGRTPFDLYILAFAVILLVSAAVSREPVVSLQAFFDRIVTPWLWFLLVVNRVRGREDLVRVIFAAALSTVVLLGMKSYFQSQASGWEISTDLYDESLYYLTGGPGAIGSPAGYAIPLALGCMMLTRRRLYQVLWGAAVAFLFYLVVASHVRAILIALLIYLPMLLFHSPRSRRLYIGSVAATGLALVLIPDLGQNVLLRFQDWSSISSIQIDQAARLDAWQAAIRMMLDHPWLGIGLDMWPNYAWNYLRPAFVTDLPQAHSIPLNYASAGGVGALIAFLIMIGVVLLKGARLWQRTTDPVLHNVAFAALGAIVVEMVNGTIGGAWYLTTGFWMMMGILVVVERMVRDRDPVINPPSRSRLTQDTA